MTDQIDVPLMQPGFRLMDGSDINELIRRVNSMYWGAVSPFLYMPEDLQQALVGGYNTANLAPYVQLAVQAVYQQGGGAVFLGPFRWLFYSGVQLYSGVEIYGVRGKTEVVAKGAAAIKLFYFAGGLGTARLLSTNVAEDARELTLGNPAGFADGTIAAFSATDPTSTQIHEWVTYVEDVTGNTLTVADPMPVGILTSDSYSIRPLSTFLERAGLRDLRLVNETTADGVFGLHVQYFDRFRLSGVDFEGFKPTGGNTAAGCYLYYGTNLYAHDCYSTNSGSNFYSAMTFYACTGMRGGALRSYADASFGIQMIGGTALNLGGLSVVGSGMVQAGRGLKFNAVCKSTFSDLIANGNANTGLAITNACLHLGITNVQVYENGWNPAGHNAGVWFSSQYNMYNRIVGITGRGNLNRDIEVNASDDNNRIYDVEPGMVVFDAGAGNIVARPDTGWTAMTGTATKGGFDTASVTLPQLAQVVKAMLDGNLAQRPPAA